MSFDITNYYTHVPLLGLIVSSSVLIIQLYTRVFKPYVDNKEKFEKDNIKVQEEKIKKEKALYDGFKRLLNIVKEESLNNNFESSNIKENSEYYLLIESISDKYKALLRKILYIHDDLTQLKFASLYILRNEMSKYFIRKAEIVNRDNPQLISNYIDISLLSYLNGIKITEQYLKEYHLEFFDDVERQGELLNINRILNHDNKLSSQHQVVVKYRKKKEELIQLIDEILMSLQLD